IERYAVSSMHDFVERSAATALNRRGSPETILLVEDDCVMRELVSEILGQNGYLVLPADSERRALNTWNQFGRRVDLLLTDVMIPYRCTGTELARKLQRIKPGLKVLFMSGFGPEICAGDPAMASGWFLPKPFSPAALVRIVS